MSETEPKKTAPKVENKEGGKKEKIAEKKKDFAGKTDKLKSVGEKKGGWDKFENKKAEYLTGAGLTVLGLMSGAGVLAALGAFIFSWGYNW